MPNRLKIYCNPEFRIMVFLYLALTKILVGSFFKLPVLTLNRLRNSIFNKYTSTLDNTFLNGFAECGMVQCIHESTHKKGSILDILLSKSSDHIKNLHVINDKAYCNSDHYPITFDIEVNCKHRTLRKRIMLYTTALIGVI